MSWSYKCSCRLRYAIKIFRGNFLIGHLFILAFRMIYSWYCCFSTTSIIKGNKSLGQLKTILQQYSEWVCGSFSRLTVARENMESTNIFCCCWYLQYEIACGVVIFFFCVQIYCDPIFLFRFFFFLLCCLGQRESVAWVQFASEFLTCWTQNSETLWNI